MYLFMLFTVENSRRYCTKHCVFSVFAQNCLGFSSAKGMIFPILSKSGIFGKKGNLMVVKKFKCIN